MFCGGHTGLVFFLSAMYINPQVTYRYNTVALPAVALLLIRPQLFRVQGSPIVAVVHGWRRSKARDSGAFRVDAETAGGWREILPKAFRGASSRSSSFSLTQSRRESSRNFGRPATQCLVSG